MDDSDTASGGQTDSAVRAAGREDDPMPPAIQVAHSLVNYLYHSGEVHLGGRIPPERRLAEAFGVGRSAVREALKSLSLLGLVRIRQGDGTYLVSDSLELLPKIMEWGLLLGASGFDDAVEARHHVQTAVAALAAERCDGRAAARLRLALSNLEAAAIPADESHESSTRFAGAEMAMHRELASAARNEVMAQMILGLQALLGDWIDRSYRSGPSARAESVDEHRSLVSAVLDGNPDGARSAMADHLVGSAQRLSAARG